MRALLLRHFVALVAIAAVGSYLALYAARPGLTPVHSDAYGYYVYLPDWFLFHDTTLEAVADDCCGGVYPSFTAIVRWPGTGRWVNAHPIGVAVMTAPFFAIAHALTRWSNLPTDGFSLYYQHAVSLAGLTYVLIGLAVLRRQLGRRFSPGVVLATLAALTFGTNLFHYASYDAGYSHAFAFCLVAALMVLTDRWWAAPTWGGSAALAALAALLVLVRHPNAIVLAVVPLAGVTKWQDVRPRLVELLERRWLLLGMAGIGTLCVLPQLALYRQATGAWLISSYGSLGFEYFRSPYVASVLIGVQKGLFFWSPILLLAIAGMAVPTHWARCWRPAVVGILAVQTYMVASWHDWQLGGSYGHRGFTDLLPLFSPFLASLFAWTARRRWVKTVVTVGATTAVALSVFQMRQYWVGILPIMDTSWEQYWAIFLRW